MTQATPGNNENVEQTLVCLHYAQTKVCSTFSKENHCG